ncbi:hypothetical protein C0995_013879 [Termitomyces sp. Mi166|nr:hypothetical protein C0995_013879 [Termitomyces sp. Mi166\
MGQHYRLFNLDTHVRWSDSVKDKLGDFFYCRMNNDHSLLRALWIPDEDKERVVVLPVHKVEGYVFPQESSKNYSEGFFGQLTTEVVDKMFGEVDDPVDLINVMTTCQRHWDIGRRHLENLVKVFFVVTSWAGDRLICLSDHAELEDLPEGMLTECEVMKIENYRSRSLWRAIRVIQTPRPRTPAVIPLKIVGAIRSSKDLLRGLKSYPTWSARTDICGALQNLIQITDMNFGNFYKGHMVFRNLTVKEYVRGDIWNMPRDSRFPGKRLKFEHVLYIRIIWSVPGLSGYQCPLDIRRGAWAGHRFDISDVKNVMGEDGIMVDGWRDVTEEVISEVMEVLHI